jgi:hypothetical protein
LGSSFESLSHVSEVPLKPESSTLAVAIAVAGVISFDSDYFTPFDSLQGRQKREYIKKGDSLAGRYHYHYQLPGITLPNP